MYHWNGLVGHHHEVSSIVYEKIVLYSSSEWQGYLKFKADVEAVKGSSFTCHVSRTDEKKLDVVRVLRDFLKIPSVGGVRKLIMDEAHTSRYSVHPGADKMYYDLRDLYWWTGFLQQPEIPEWKWEKITMDFITKLPKRSSGHDTIWVVVDRLTKLAYFLPIRENYKMEKLAKIYINEIVARHGVPVAFGFLRDAFFYCDILCGLPFTRGSRVEDWTGAVAALARSLEDGFCVLSKHPNVTIPLLPDFGGVTASIRLPKKQPLTPKLKGSPDNPTTSDFQSSTYQGFPSLEARLVHYKKNEVLLEESINLLKLDVRLRDNALAENKKKLDLAEKERDELKLTLEKFQNSSKSLNNLLESQVSGKSKTRLGYNADIPVVQSYVTTSEISDNQEYNKSTSDKGYHEVPPPYTRNFIPSKPDVMFLDEIVESVNMDVITVDTTSDNKKVKSKLESAAKDDDSEIDFVSNVKTVKPSIEKIKFVKPAWETVEKAVLTRSGKINTAGASVNTAKRPVNTIGSKPTIQVYNGLDPQKSPALLLFVQNNTQQKEYKEKGVIDSGCSRYMTGNKCYLTKYEEFDGGFISFGNGKGRISGLKENKSEPEQEYILIPICTPDPFISQSPKVGDEDDGLKSTKLIDSGDLDKNDEIDQRSEFERILQQEQQPEQLDSINSVNTASSFVSAVGPSNTDALEEQLVERYSPFKNAFTLLRVPNVIPRDDTGIFDNAYDDEEVEEEVDMNNVISSYYVPDTSFTKFHKDHHEE
ncbi:ribonuclease H-like domain-containing protein [Tanacetum coccineum]|uniref:Ribonuclease H-like domain-containing protein n=1 Tax=Tanacetum coccineum TaxID=301880 RepID=A0ABQ5HHF9_9ASTR